MVNIPLSLKYRYDSGRKVYCKINSHIELTIPEYEAMEAKERDDFAWVLKMAGWVSLIGIIAIVAIVEGF